MIDIDILYKEGISFETEALTVPHRELLKRNFVLVPLSEITDHLIINEKKVFIDNRIDSGTRQDVTLYKARQEITIDG